jgi:hypothetical protein
MAGKYTKQDASWMSMILTKSLWTSSAQENQQADTESSSRLWSEILSKQIGIRQSQAYILAD